MPYEVIDGHTTTSKPTMATPSSSAAGPIAPTSSTSSESSSQSTNTSSAAPARKMQTFLAGNFVTSAGSTLFRRHRKPDGSDELQMCVLYQTRKELYSLPKGRKDCNETVERAAVRETYEETGYPCELVPLRIATRATWPGGDGRDVATVRDGLVEPAGMTLINRGKKGMKVVWWYVTRVADGAVKVDGTQMESEAFVSSFVEANEAAKKFSHVQHREIARQAIELVRTTEEALGKRII